MQGDVAPTRCLLCRDFRFLKAGYMGAGNTHCLMSSVPRTGVHRVHTGAASQGGRERAAAAGDHDLRGHACAHAGAAGKEPLLRHAARAGHPAQAGEGAPLLSADPRLARADKISAVLYPRSRRVLLERAVCCLATSPELSSPALANLDRLLISSTVGSY